MPFRKSLSVLGILVCSQAFAQGNPETLSRIAHQATKNNKAWSILTELCQKIGPRVTGTAGQRNAVAWAEAKMKSFGLQNVHREQWGSLPFTFERGTRTHGHMIAPFPMELTVAAPAYAPGTEGPRRAKVAVEPENPLEIDANPEKYRGRWILMRAPGTMSGARRPGEVSATEAKLDSLGVAGKVFGSSNNDQLVWTNGRFDTVKPDAFSTDVRVMLSGYQFRLVKGQLELGDVELEFELSQHLSVGSAHLENVIGEIPGTEKPDELVIVGAHLDSWDTPGSQGCSDNGTGSSSVLEAARQLMASGAKPKRTIRFILFTGEEQGLLGSSYDVEQLKSQGKFDKISAMFNEDAGSNWHSSVSAIEEQVPMLKEALKDVQKAFPDKPIVVNTIAEPPKGKGGSDHTSYSSVGIPAFQFGKTGPQKYGYIWHTQNDRLENAVPEGVKHMSSNLAMVSYNIACADQLLPRRVNK